MADDKMAEAVKAFAAKVTTSKTNERRKILSNLLPHISKSEFPEQALKGILKKLQVIFGRYCDKQSRNAVNNLIICMAEHHPKAMLSLFPAVFEEFAQNLTKQHPSAHASGIAMTCHSWCCLIIKHALKNAEACQGMQFNKIVQLQCVFLYEATLSQKSVVTSASYQHLTHNWKMIPGLTDKYIEVLLKMEPSQFSCVMINYLYKYFGTKKQIESINKHKESFLQHFVKGVLGSRTKPLPAFLNNCKDFLRHVTHDDFKVLLPACQKSILRNPEIILETFGYMIAGLSIDLSQYADEIIKQFATQLHSKEEITRQEAIFGVKHLAKQCSDAGAVEKVLKHLSSVLNGSEGKLTVVQQKMGVLSGIGCMSENTVTGVAANQNLSGSVAEIIIPFLQQEVHEGTLIHALSMLSLWCTKFTTEVPVKLVEWFKKGVTLKHSTSAVRNAYIQCMNVTFSGDSLLQGAAMIPLLLQTLEKAKNQPSQAQLVTEALSAAVLLSKLSLSDIQVESQLASLWPILLDMDKLLFVNEKFLSAASDEALMNLASLIERLVLEHSQRLTDKSSKPFYKALVYILTHGSYKLRSHGQKCAKRILSVLGGARISLALISEYKDLLNSQKLPDPNIVESDEGGGLKVIPPRVLSDALLAVAGVPNADNREAHDIAMATLIDSNHPLIGNPDLWTEVLNRLKLEPGHFVSTHSDEISDIIKTQGVWTTAIRNAITVLAQYGVNDLITKLVNYVKEELSDPQMCVVTLQEYMIMKTPTGQLYDKSILEGAAQQESKLSNVKKASKLYSYKEQMAMLEFEKEKEIKNKEPKLSKKQQEMVQVQLAKEEEIRTRLLQLDQVVEYSCAVMNACVAGNAELMRRHIPSLLQSLVPLMSSPLASPHTGQLYLNLRHAAFCQPSTPAIADLVAYATLRQMEPASPQDPEWTQESSLQQAVRTVTKLHAASIQTEGENDPNVKLFAAPTVAYFFSLLRAVLMGRVKSEEAAAMCLRIIHHHAMSRNAAGSQDLDEFGPELLPRKQMLQVLLHLVATSDYKKGQLAAQALLEVAACASGMDDCAAAEQDEIDVLLEAVKSPATPCREAALQGLCNMVFILPTPDYDYTAGMKLTQRAWVARFDAEDNVRTLAEKLWTETGLSMSSELCTGLVEDILDCEPVIQNAAAESLASILSQDASYVPAVLEQLLTLYEEKLYMPPPVLDNFGRVISEPPVDKSEARSGIAHALSKISTLIPEENIVPLFDFFVQKALSDRDEEVRKNMLKAAVAAVNDHGKNHVNKLLPVFEIFLQEAPSTASYDAVRQSVVILMGSLAKHLEKDDPKVKPIVAKLIETLATPSQQVQEAVANCIYPLVPAIKADTPELVRKLLQLLLESESYGERRGAAYGLAGLVKGLGILALKQQGIMETLQNAIQNKKNPRYREGALFAFEMLCSMLGRLFEPYVVHILPHLLLCFGDGNQYVREAADDTAKAVMSKLSAHGVKLVLPSLLTALEEDSWRTKTGSVELLGAMAFCAPKQLSACLPSIVPKLTEVLTDSHIKVQKAGAQALSQIGSVIRNPEIQAIVPVLLDALQDPTRKTTLCLQSLLELKFVHFIDAPSLALIMPVVQRAFQDRSTETRKMAAQIIGNMYSLTDQKDLAPYLPSVIPGLKQSLLDPVPDVRNVSARALGTMVKGMGESGFEDLMPWLMQTLTSENNSVDRSGAAQGLSEVVGGLGLEKLDKLMPDIIQTAERNDIAPHVRDGYVMLYIYLPTVFGNDFIKYVGPIIPSVLKALSDEAEFVRDTALKAGQRIVNMYADTAITLLLPELEKGLFDDNWRIRYSSVQLLGDLLYRVSGVTGKMSTESAGDDDNFGTETSQQTIMRALGEDRRNRVLAGLYMGRSDTALMVRQAALHVWKVIVAHTPKTLREILSTLFTLLLGCLASTSYDKRQVAARTLGDIVRKLGEKVLPEIIPILESGLESERSDQRQGVCIGLSEIMSSTTREHVIVFADSLIPTVRKALCDPLPEVRQAAAKTFDNLHSNIGSRALDDILPNLLNKLGDEENSEFALDGLKQVMAVKSRVVLPYLIPQLTSAPVNTRALAFLSSVAGDALTKHLNRILPALISALSHSTSQEEELQHCQAVILSVSDEIGVRTIMDELLRVTNSKDCGERWAAVTLLNAFCSKTKADISDYVAQLFRGLLIMFTDSEVRVLEAAWHTLNAITKKLDASEMLSHISNVRQALRLAVSDFQASDLPGFCLPKKGITPILPIFREGILNGPQELKETAAIGLGEVIKHTSAEALKPSVVNITGPLIRILGDRFSWSVKVAVLDTLGLLLGKCGAMLKPFLPQLQTTFVKALNDPNRSVRLKAASALSKLIIIHTRVDPLFTELMTGVKNADDTGIRETMLQALRGCISGAGNKAAEPIKKQMLDLLENLLSVPEDPVRMAAAGCTGALCQWLNDDQLSLLMNMHLLDQDPSLDWIERHGRAVALGVAVKEAGERIDIPEYSLRIVKAILTCTSADRIPLCLSGLRSAGFLINHYQHTQQTVNADLLSALAKTMKHESNDVKQLGAQIVIYIARRSEAALPLPVIKALIPMLVNGTKEKNTMVKSHCEVALVNLLQLKRNTDTLQACLNVLDSGMKDSLSDVVNKVLKKYVNQPDSPPEEIDETTLI